MTLSKTFTATVATVLAALLALGLAYRAEACPPANLPVCAEEDGNPDGLPCIWIDPDTGTAYYVTSENYR